MGPTDIAELIRQHLRPLVLFACQWDDAAAEDAAHDAFVRLAELVRDGKPPENAVGWLYRVVRNGAIDRLRHKRQASQHAEHYARHNDWFASHEPAQSNDDMIDGRILTEMLEQLPLEQREIIVAHLWGGLTFRETAELVGRPFSTVRREFQKGLDSLRSQLRPDNSDRSSSDE